MLLLDIVWWLWARVQMRRLGSRRGWRIASAILAITNTVGLAVMIVARIVSRDWDAYLWRWLVAEIYLWHFIALPIAILIASLERGIAGVRWTRRRLRAEPAPAAPVVTRRAFLGAAVATGPAIAAAATGVAWLQMRQFRVRPITLQLPTLPAALDGLTIAQVADMHVGRFTNGKVLREIVNATNDLNADLVVVPGDLIDHSLADLPEALNAILNMRSRFGTIACEGNHDLFEGREPFERAVRAANIPLLVNQATSLNVRGEKIQFLGVRWGALQYPATDRRGRTDAAIESSMQQVVPLRDPSAFPILLAHHPHAFDPAHAAGIPLTLSGHTHGGQIMAGPDVGFGPMMFRYWSGLYQKPGASLVVSNGVGNWFPLRINAPAEIVHLTLRRGEQHADEPPA